MAEGRGFLQSPADMIGISEPALRLLLSIFLGFPGAIFYRKFVFPLSKLQNHIYFIAVGISLCLFNFGSGTIHSLISVIVTYLMVTFLPHGTPLKVGSFVFHMAYILAGYYFTETETYDIKWTTPHCVLVLRLIGLTFDICDTHAFKNGAPKKEMDYYGIDKTPGLLEIASYVYFPPSFMAGPQFPYHLYERFMNGEFAQFTGYKRAALLRFGQGALYLVLHQVCGMIVSNESLLSSSFLEHNILVRMVLLGIWGKYTFYKYIAIWLMSEGNAIRYGLTFKGYKDEKKEVEDWSGCANIDVRLFEMATEFNHYILSFNINTNRWVARHIFKRLVFLGNKDLSQILTLLFLSIWHGFHTGYYVTFLFEFIIVHIDRDVAKIKNGNPTLKAICERMEMKPVLFVIQKIYTVVGLGWCIIPFGFLEFDHYWLAMGQVSYVGLIFIGTYPIVHIALKTMFPAAKREKKDSSDATGKKSE